MNQYLSFNEAGADAPERRLGNRRRITQDVGFNEAGADAPERHAAVEAGMATRFRLQ